VDVSQANCDVFLARLSKGAGDSPITGRGDQTRSYGDESEDWLRVDQALDRLPHKDSADDQQTNRIEDISRSEEVARETGPQRVGQEQEAKGQFIGEVVHRISQETQAVGFDAPDCLDGQDGGVQTKGNSERTT
jgi:hypothetical protein